MSRVSELKSEIVGEITEFLEKYNIKVLNAVDIDEGSSPIIIEDYSDLEDHYTLDRIVVENVEVTFGSFTEINLECSSCYGNDEVSLYNVNAEVAESVLDWLKENEEKISEIVAEEK